MFNRSNNLIILRCVMIFALSKVFIAEEDGNILVEIFKTNEHNQLKARGLQHQCSIEPHQVNQR